MGFPSAKVDTFFQIVSIPYWGKVLYMALKKICIYGIKSIDVSFERF